MSGCDPESAQLREKTAKRSSSVSSAENTSSLSVEVSVRLLNMDTLIDCDSSSTYGGFGDPILRIRFIVHQYGATTTLVSEHGGQQVKRSIEDTRLTEGRIKDGKSRSTSHG